MDNENKMKTILISGMMRRGKDTFCKLLRDICDENHIKTQQYSFAYELKRDLQPLISPMGINIMNPTDDQKKIIRGVMISYGCAWREINPDHWVDKVDFYIQNSPPDILNIITDNRFLSETDYFINKYGRENVIVVEVQQDNGPTPPKEELENQPKITAIADHIVNWPHVGENNLDKLRVYAQDFYDKFIE